MESILIIFQLKALESVSGSEVQNSETVSNFLLHAVDQRIHAFMIQCTDYYVENE